MVKEVEVGGGEDSWEGGSRGEWLRMMIKEVGVKEEEG